MQRQRSVFRSPGFLTRLAVAAAALLIIPALATVAFAQVPPGLRGQWSNDQSRCENIEAEGVIVFDIGPRQIGWYEVVCEIRNIRPTKDGVFLRVDCKKGGGLTASGDIDIRRVSPEALEVYVSPLGLSKELHYSLRQCPRAADTNPSDSRPRTYWNHNGSTIYSIADGTTREFYYERPRRAMLLAGARRGSLLFTGKAVGDTYEGTAYTFKQGCGPFGFPVSGPILDDYHRVVLLGQMPRVDHDCRITGYRTATMEFVLTSR